MRVEDLYRDIIMEHYKNPRNKGLLNNDKYKKVNLLNPSCGDDVTIQVLVEDDIIKDVRHDGHGCSICCSSASMMSETLVNKTTKEAQNIIDEYMLMLTGKEYNKNILKGEAIAYIGVSKFPARIRCASIAWKAMEEALVEAKNDGKR
ncbi:MAG TPA: SUF system NifU family Fe-S cluster assembly protein [Acholeplasmataceae bacterium]|nr:SUF system NifU family Fe-S cluster assembly protein [Acholeplasmataceae bacterium]HQC30706.1 SUF system NifU family Fe-S cluster assembly protein [Acholeplasmataceae bacterium]